MTWQAAKNLIALFQHEISGKNEDVFSVQILYETVI